MKHILVVILFLPVSFITFGQQALLDSSSYLSIKQHLPLPDYKDSVVKIEMKLSAFGVESDDFPSIDVVIDFTTNTSHCHKWNDDPKYKDSIYSFSDAELKGIFKLLQKANLNSLKNDYRRGESDQPTSTTIIYTRMRTYKVVDYGLIGDYPLTELYRLVYKL